MEEGKALHRLLEAADLIGMIEEMMNPQTSERLSESARAGMRITLRNVRDLVMSSHENLSGEFVQRARGPLTVQPSIQPSIQSVANQQTTQVFERALTTSNVPHTIPPHAVSQTPSPIRPGGTTITRKDLKASLERLAERA